MTSCCSSSKNPAPGASTVAAPTALRWTPGRFLRPQPTPAAPPRRPPPSSMPPTTPPKLHCLPAGTPHSGSAKTVIFIRHAESEWNLACTDAEGRKGSSPVGGPDGTMSTDRFAYEDTPLTPKGHRQARELGLLLAAAAPPIELVVASPLERTLQTAVRVFPEPTRIVAHEGPREMMFVRLLSATPLIPHPCLGCWQLPPIICEAQPTEPTLPAQPRYETINKRGPKQAKAARFPSVDWSQVPDEHDEMFSRCRSSPHGRERSAEVRARVADFLEWVMGRPERVVAVVSHGLTMRAVFWEDAVRKVFAVAPTDLSAVRLKDLGNTTMHEVVLSREPAPAVAAGLPPAGAGAVTRSTRGLAELDDAKQAAFAVRAAARARRRWMLRAGALALLALGAWAWRHFRRAQ
eukprot:COSAG04_NODE_190_length_20948_cov_7.298863_13_plen_406_part_00